MSHLLKKLVQRYDLKYQGNASASGYLGRYPMSMSESSGPRALGANLWATCENAEEDQALTDFLNSLAAASDGMIMTAGWSGDNADRFGVLSFTFRDTKGEEENTELFLASILQRLQIFLEEHHFTVKCGLCADTENVGVYLVDGLYSVSHCQACNENWLQEVRESVRAVWLSPAEWVKGIFGSLFGALFGVFIWVVVHRVGYAAALCGIVVALGSVRGFEKRVKKQNSVSICVQIFIFIAACIFAELLCLVIDLREAWAVEFPGITFLQVAFSVPFLLWEVPAVREQVFGNLFFGLFLGGLASFGMFRNVWHSSRHGVSCTELIPPRNK